MWNGSSNNRLLIYYDNTIPKQRAENTAGKKCCTEIEFSVQTTWWMDGWIERVKCCGTVDKNESKWTFLPHNSTSSSSSSSSSWENTIHTQLMPKYMPKDTLNANDCGLFYKHFLIKCMH
jgi:hypothetical protein